MSYGKFKAIASHWKKHWPKSSTTEMSTRSIVPSGGTFEVSDIAYATQELTRDLTAPTTESIAKVKCLLRYIAGTKDHCQRLCPNVTLETSNCTLDLDCYVDSDWARCRRTRKSTSGTVVQILKSTVSFGSRTQGTIALTPDEAEITP